MKNTKICLALFTFFFGNTCFGYEIETHRKLSEEAVKASVVDTRLKDFGLNSLNDQLSDGGFFATKLSVSAWIMEGSVSEDDILPDARFRHHFYNPINGSGHGLGLPSVQWGLEPIKINTQDYSFGDAREYLYKGLTLPGKAEREKNFALTFRSIGQVIHLVQDSAQPQHTRIDSHGSGSTYERYTDLRRDRRELKYSGYSPVYGESDKLTFNHPKKLWHTADRNPGAGKGIAEFSNHNFVTLGTNLRGTRSGNTIYVQSANGFPSPNGLGAKIHKRQITDADLLGPPGPPKNPRGLIGEMWFVGTDVTDNYLGGAVKHNERTSTFSIFDADLEKYSLRGWEFSLNRFNFEAAHDFLIPRAVGYSAGLINYFFRGQIDFVPDKVNTGKHIIKNLGPDDMSGAFTLYYDAVDGNRYPVAGDAPDKTWESLASPKNSQVDKLSFTPPTTPAPKTPDEYMLVFNGDMGEEKAIPGITVGAVAAKKVEAGADFYIAPSNIEAYGRLGRFSSAGDFLDMGSIKTQRQFLYGFMAYGQDIFHVETPYDGRVTPSYAAKNGVPFHTQVAVPLNDIAGNGKEIFVVAAEVIPVVSVYDFDGRFLRSFSILPQYAIQGGFVQLVANDSYLVASANFTMVISDTAGSSRLTLDLGQNIYESILAVSRDRIYRANYRESVVQIYDFNGASRGSVSVSGAAKITCMDATESKLYVVTSDSVGFPPYGGRIHIFSRNAATDAYLLLKEISIPYGLDSWQHACSVDRASSRAQK